MHAWASLVVPGTAFIAVTAGFAAPPSAVAFATAPSESRSLLAAQRMSKEAIAARLGMPSQILSPEVWVYREVRVPYPEVAQRGYDTLIVIFSAGHVEKLRFVNGEELTALLARARIGPSTNQLAQAMPKAGP